MNKDLLIAFLALRKTSWFEVILYSFIMR
jgi:hypothetical protein